MQLSCLKIRLRCNYSTYSPTKIYRSVIGPVSSDLYLLSSIVSGSNYCTIRKLDTSESLVWENGYGFDPNLKSMRIDSTEQYIYIEAYSSNLSVLKLYASSGSILSQIKL